MTKTHLDIENPAVEVNEEPLTGEAIMAQFRTSHDLIWETVGVSHELGGAKTQSAAALAELVGKFVGGNLAVGKGIVDLPLSEDFEAVSDVWLKTRVNEKLLAELLAQQQKHEREVLDAMLKGTTITAKSINGQTFGVSRDGSGATYPRGSHRTPNEVTGTFHAADPADGVLWIKDDMFYIVDVFDRGDRKKDAVSLTIE